MIQMNPIDVIAEIKKEADFSEVFHKTSFVCVRKTKKGETQDVVVEILDAGPDAGMKRYVCVAVSKKTRKEATGNPAGSIREALSIVHWKDLDE